MGFARATARQRTRRAPSAPLPWLVPGAARVPAGPRPSFSVIVAAYQVADVIGDALRSIQQQSLQPLEVIVCDDGSTDDLGRALAPFRGAITLVQKENGGEASAKNAAAAAAQGDFLAILDADDVYFPRRLEAFSELAQSRPDLDILTSDGILVANGKELRHVYDGSWRFETEDQRRAILQRNFIFGLAAVRRTTFEEHGGFDESIRWTTDWDLWLRMILRGSRAGCVSEPLALYRLREQGLTSQRRQLLLGKLATLTKARTLPDLQDAERRTLDTSIEGVTRDLALLDLKRAIREAAPDARDRAVAVARSRAYAGRTRLFAVALALAPHAARRVLNRRAESAWTGAAGIRVPRARAR
jgi:cellulose synthase/poly-beta-1,6-N-acetylglucosamine synthase-like glycosyltransferase